MAAIFLLRSRDDDAVLIDARVDEARSGGLEGDAHGQDARGLGQEDEAAPASRTARFAGQRACAARDAEDLVDARVGDGGVQTPLRRPVAVD